MSSTVDNQGVVFNSYQLLEATLQMKPDDVIANIVETKSLIRKMIDGSLKPNHLMIIVKLLNKALASKKLQEVKNLSGYLQKSAILLRIGNFLDDISEDSSFRIVKNVPSFIDDLLDFCARLLASVPSIALDDTFEQLMPKVKSTIAKIDTCFNMQVDDGIVYKCVDLDQKVTECRLSASRHKPKGKHQKINSEAHSVNFRKISVFPTAKDLQLNSLNYLRANVIEGKYDDVEHYLDVHFRLIREDFIDPLRVALKKYNEAKAASQDGGRLPHRYEKIKLYFKTRFEKNKFEARGSISYLLNFDVEGKIKTNWETSKSFKFGSLLLFTKDDFKSFFCGTVDQNDLQDLKKGRLYVTLVEAVETNEEFFDSVFTMAESDEFFEPYCLIMNVLARYDENTFPMMKYIVEVNTEIDPPGYLRKFRSFNVFEHEVHPTDMNTWPLCEEVNLDEHQYKAMKLALTKSFSIIQGPPGTGKTFLGLKIVEILLKNMQLHEFNIRNPILVICYTNHALDQFLEGILDYTDSIVRVGGQSKSTRLQKYNLKEKKFLSKNAMRNLNPKDPMVNLHRQIGKTVEAMRHVLRKIDTLNEDKELVEKPKGIISYDFLKNVMLHREQKEISNEYDLLLWLLDVEEIETYFEDDEISYDDILTGKDQTVDVKKLEDSSKPPIDENYFASISEVTIEADEDTRIKYCLTLQELGSQCRQLFNEIKSRNDESDKNDQEDFLQQKEKLKTQKLVYNILKDNLQNHFHDKRLYKKTCKEDLRRLPLDHRWNTYWNWIEQIKNEFDKKMKFLKNEYRFIAANLESFQRRSDFMLLKETAVVGMTTTGAAHRRGVLEMLKPSIVIVEEAAEVLEAHIITAITKETEQLILIGDHKQLKPSTATYELSYKYNMDVSLFERMINNKMECPILKTQHRMRPEISRLITPSIYKELQDHPFVLKYKSVNGMQKNVFFVNHNEPEQNVEDSASFMNIHEAEFLCRLSNYLLLQGYEPLQITILSMYAGQVHHLLNIRKNTPELKKVHITAVDDYQGEENDIILLSLVRSNPAGNIGFLNVANRICVSLSRAKQGFYIIGNMNILQRSSDLWKTLKTTLETEESVGNELILCCQKHKTESRVSYARDFDHVKNGGCSVECGEILECAHICQNLCHSSDTQHETKFACRQSCLRTLLCGHEIQLQCCIKDSDYSCEEIVKYKSASCSHILSRRCFEYEDVVKCQEPCGSLLKCGHICPQKCHQKTDPNHLMFICEEKCLRLNGRCSKQHTCEKLCFEECGLCQVEELFVLDCGHAVMLECSTNLNTVKCTKKCTRTCPSCNQKCTKLCWESCDPCRHEVKKIIPECRHEITVPCSETPSQKLCQALITINQKSVCEHGHINNVPCNALVCGFNAKDYLQFCDEPCDKQLICGHTCSGTCGRCLQGRLHKGCRKICDSALICGHNCKYLCELICPPCKERSIFLCVHQKKPKKCGASAFTCEERCQWKCRHNVCTKKCGEFCDKEPCYKPCSRKLLCTHDCIGFCGEPCPFFCRVCDAKEMSRSVFGYERRPNSRYVWLEDCNHTIESDIMESHISRAPGEIKILRCPACQTPISKTLRYANQVKQLCHEITEIKQKNCRIDNRVTEMRIEIKSKLQAFFEFAVYGLPIQKVKNYFKKVIYDRYDIIPNQNLRPLLYFSKMLNDIGVLLTKVDNEMKEFREFKEGQELLGTILNKVEPKLLLVNKQTINDVRYEILRFHRMVSYCFFLRQTSNKKLKSMDNIKTLRKDVDQNLFTPNDYNSIRDKSVEDLFTQLKDITKNNFISTNQLKMIDSVKFSELVGPLESVYKTNNVKND